MLLLLKNMYKVHVERMRGGTLSKDDCENSQPQLTANGHQRFTESSSGIAIGSTLQNHKEFI